MGRITRQDTYSGQLFYHGHGCALWNPEPNRIGTCSQDRWKDIYAEGVRIGDVGLISDFGDFRTLFNIFRPPNDLVNEVYGVPAGFEPLEFRENLFLFSNGLYHLENARVFSKHTQEIKLGADGTILAPGIPVAPGIGLEYRSSREQGAVLILPEGARRVDYEGLQDIRNYTKKNAESWYRYLNDQVGMDADNGSLYVITGFDRTSCYENLSFASSSRDTSLSFRFSCPLLSNGDFGRLSLSYSSLPQHEHWRGGSNPGHTLHNLSPFVRGFKIMIRQSFRYKPAIKILDLVKADPKALLYKGSIPSLSSSGSTSPLSSLNSSTIRSPAPPSTSSTSGSSTRSSRHSDSQFSPQSPGALDLSPITSYSSLAGDTDSVRSGSLSPRGSSIFDSDSDSESGVPFQLHHPSDVINEYILDKCPDTDVAITHDDEWASVLEESDSQFPDKPTLISRMLDKFPSKFEQNSKDDSVLGTLMSPTLRRIDPYRASTPSKRKSPETPADDADDEHDSVLGTLMSPTLRRIDPCCAPTPSTPSKRKSPEIPTGDADNEHGTYHFHHRRIELALSPKRKRLSQPKTNMVQEEDEQDVESETERPSKKRKSGKENGKDASAAGSSKRTSEKAKGKKKAETKFKSEFVPPSSDIDEDASMQGDSTGKDQEDLSSADEGTPKPISSKTNPPAKPIQVNSKLYASTNGDDSDTGLSDLIDEPPKKKSKSKTATKASGEKNEKPSNKKKPSKDEKTIKRLKGFINACGVQKPWSQLFDGIEDQPSKQIKMLRKILEDLGMEGRPSMEKAKAIKAKSDLENELGKSRRLLAGSKQGTRSSRKAQEAEESDEGNASEEDVNERPVKREMNFPDERKAKYHGLLGRSERL
ncbi:hypothetical protein D9758_005115 [Tetrapyrgos nigripes]|uniref:Uncharacterized protein n=1 Tax=Tetrapyrgos nigripes TaxID=182062 RepID=A0A8H5GW41_9AGAR|nr:hypothetical protein D9758_005115 [Tetrapyrgos nigripes]